MGQLVAKLLPQQAQDTIAHIIPDRANLLQMVEKLVAFEEELKQEKLRKAEATANKKALKQMRKIIK